MAVLYSIIIFITITLKNLRTSYIRAFIYKMSIYIGYWGNEILIVHKAAYSKELSRALREINTFLGNNRDDIVVLRINDYHKSDKTEISQNLDKVLGIFSDVDLSLERNPRLGSAIENNRRVVVFANEAFSDASPYTHTLAQVDSFKRYGKTTSRIDRREPVKRILNDKRSYNSFYHIEIDWFLSYGMCLWNLAKLCDDEKFNDIKYINNEIIKETNRPINAVTVDFVGRGSIRLSKIVQDINKCNVQIFKYNKSCDSYKYSYLSPGK